MNFDITQLKKVRLKKGLTQSEFAKKANISQSMIAKIESGRLDPTYSKVKKIEHAIELLEEKEELKAKDIMIKNIISLKPAENITSAIKKMNEKKISQLPVIENQVVVGLITENSLLNQISSNNKITKVKDVMIDSPPIVSKNTNLSVLKSLLKFYPIILIKEKGKLIGLITKSDLIKKLF